MDAKFVLFMMYVVYISHNQFQNFAESYRDVIAKYVIFFV